jgi:hypothetical protein
MQTIRGSAGGIAAAPILRARAVDKYYQSPNVCRNCNKVIMVTDNEKVQFARRRKFCNHSCAAQSNNAKRPKKEINSCTQACALRLMCTYDIQVIENQQSNSTNLCVTLLNQSITQTSN